MNISDNIFNKDWQQFLKGNNGALKTIWIAFYPYLVTTAFYFLKDNTKAEDVVADVFKKLLEMSVEERLQKLQDVADNQRVFLKIVVKNKCLDLIKTEKNRKNILKGVVTLFSNRHYYLLEEDFKHMTDLLPPRQKEVLEMHLQGFDHNEISEKLNISYQTCKNTLSEAKKKIRELWFIFMN